MIKEEDHHIDENADELNQKNVKTVKMHRNQSKAIIKSFAAINYY